MNAFQDAPPEYELIEHLDWQETFPCEHGYHSEWMHTEPATYHIEVSHPKCGFSVKELWCLQCYETVREAYRTATSVTCYYKGKGCVKRGTSGEFSIVLLDALM